MSFTLKVVFIGLMAVSSTSSDQDLIILAASQSVAHLPIVYQVKGTCKGDLCQWNAGQLLHDDNRLAWLLPAADVMLAIDSMSLHHRPLDLRWQTELPSVSRMSSSPAPLSRSCATAVGACPAAVARVWVPAEELEVCHYLHLPMNDKGEKPGPRLRYWLANYRAPVADAVMMEVEEVESFVVRADRMVGDDPFGEVELEPTDGEVILVVSNLPLQKGERNDEMEIPSRLEHFRAFYPLVDKEGGKRARSSTAVPTSPTVETGDPPEMKCEDVFLSFVDDVAYAPRQGRAGLVTVPHGASECDMATIP